MYCKNCGNRINDNAKFCSACGASQINTAYAPDAAPQENTAYPTNAVPQGNTAYPTNAVPQGNTSYPYGTAPSAAQSTAGRPAVQKKQKLGGLLLLIAAIALLVLGAGYIAMAVVGKTTTGYVTRYERKMYESQDESTRNPNRYQIYYEFTANSERYTGSVTKVLKHGIVVSSSNDRQTIRVRYLPFWPHMNSEDNEKLVLSGLVMLGLGILLLVFFIKSKSKQKV